MKYIILVIALAGCSGEISITELKWANKVCEPNHGVSKVFARPFQYPVIICTNGAHFYTTEHDFD